MLKLAKFSFWLIKKAVIFLKSTVLPKVHKTVIIVSAWLRTQMWVKVCGLCQHNGPSNVLQGWSAVLHRRRLLETVYIWHNRLGSDVCSKLRRWPCPISKGAGQGVASSTWNKFSWQRFSWPDRYHWEGLLLDFKSGQSWQINKGFSYRHKWVSQLYRKIEPLLMLEKQKLLLQIRILNNVPIT